MYTFTNKINNKTMIRMQKFDQHKKDMHAKRNQELVLYRMQNQMFLSFSTSKKFFF